MTSSARGGALRSGTAATGPTPEEMAGALTGLQGLTLSRNVLSSAHRLRREHGAILRRPQSRKPESMSPRLGQMKQTEASGGATSSRPQPPVTGWRRLASTLRRRWEDFVPHPRHAADRGR